MRKDLDCRNILQLPFMLVVAAAAWLISRDLFPDRVLPIILVGLASVSAECTALFKASRRTPRKKRLYQVLYAGILRCSVVVLITGFSYRIGGDVFCSYTAGFFLVSEVLSLAETAQVRLPRRLRLLKDEGE